MPGKAGALTIVLLIGMVLTRIVLLKQKGIQAMHFGRLDRTDFLLPPLVFFYVYLIFAAGFWLLHRQVLREEAFLKEHYGGEHLAYCRKVRRYL